MRSLVFLVVLTYVFANPWLIWTMIQVLLAARPTPREPPKMQEQSLNLTLYVSGPPGTPGVVREALGQQLFQASNADQEAQVRAGR